jgi:hypothetical protein
VTSGAVISLTADCVVAAPAVVPDGMILDL